MDGAMHKSTDNSSGFTLVEMLMVIAILGVVMAMAIGITTSFVNSSKSDSALVSAINAVEMARYRAVGERREFQLVFTPPNRIQVIRIEVPGPTTTTVSNVYLDNGQQYVKFTGVADTPDTFGNASAIDFGVTPTIRFTSDGSLLDSSGDPVNGSVFFGDPARSSSARAITIFGATGLIHAWKWDGTQWNE
jgi:prepilin-type N-terminal cleavage/methylation domain-containing protein